MTIAAASVHERSTGFILTQMRQSGCSRQILSNVLFLLVRKVKKVIFSVTSWGYCFMRIFFYFHHFTSFFLLLQKGKIAESVKDRTYLDQRCLQDPFCKRSQILSLWLQVLTKCQVFCHISRARLRSLAMISN